MPQAARQSSSSYTSGALPAITQQTLRQARARGLRTHGLPGCRPQKCSPAGLFLPPPRSVDFPSSLCNFRAQPLYLPQFAHDATYTLQTTLYQSFSTFLNSPQLYCHCSRHEDGRTLPPSGRHSARMPCCGYRLGGFSSLERKRKVRFADFRKPSAT